MSLPTLTTLPEGLGVMTLAEVSVSRFSLSVDAFDTIRAVLDSGNTPWGRRLHDALIFATTEETAYAVAP